MRGLLTLLWHGPVDARRGARDVRRRHGQPARPGRRPLPRPRRAARRRTASATIRVGYRKPNDLSALRARRRRRRRPRRAGAARARFVVMGHSFGGAVAIQTGAVLGDALPGRRHALDAVGRVRDRVGARRDAAAACSTAPTTRSCRRRRARSCRCSPVTARSCCSRARATCSPKPPTRSASASTNGSPTRFGRVARRLRCRRAWRRSARTRRCSRRRRRRTRGPTARGGGAAAR